MTVVFLEGAIFLVFTVAAVLVGAWVFTRGVLAFRLEALDFEVAARVAEVALPLSLCLTAAAVASTNDCECKASALAVVRKEE